MNKTIYLRRPMRPVTTIILTSEKTAKNQMVSNTNFDQNSLSFFENHQ